MCICVRVVFCLCLHACYSKAERGVDSFMCTVWSGLCRNQAHTADNSTITHTHRLTHTHTVHINCSKELQNYKEVTSLRRFFKSVLYGGIFLYYFVTVWGFSQADILSASFCYVDSRVYSVVLTLRSDWLNKCVCVWGGYVWKQSSWYACWLSAMAFLNTISLPIVFWIVLYVCTVAKQCGKVGMHINQCASLSLSWTESSHAWVHKPTWPLDRDTCSKPHV